ncbi:MAG: MG2 domain-containing protein [Blastocatellia bacterium]|nr:MG2 domain-containing protein [Blastocatellia bacterium]
MKNVIAFALLCALLLAPTHAQQLDYETLKAQAEKFYAEASYSRARELYLKADALELSPAETRWVDFRLADTLWRSQAATQTADNTKYEEARQQLETLVRDVKREEDRDFIWAEVQESLGDFWWTRRNSKNWHQGWQHYQQALDWWAGSADIEMARKRYLEIVWTIAKPEWSEPYYYYGYYGNYVPIEVLENALKIANTDNDRAHAHYLIAMTVRGQGGDWDRRQRVPEEFEAALAPGKATDWHDDALYYYAEWLTNNGRITRLDNGQWRQEADYVKALELFQHLISVYEKGETRYYDQAKQQIENITKPAVGVGVSNIFLPDSEIQFYLNWRNTKKVDLALYKVDLTSDVRFSDKNVDPQSFFHQIDLTGREKAKAWTKETQDKGDYKPGQEMMRVEGKLPTGAYVLEAKSETASARDLVLVTDTSLVLKTSGKQALVYFCNALDGAPVAQANVKVWEKYYNNKDWAWREITGATNKDGIAVFDLTDNVHNVQLFVAAAASDRQAFSNGYSYGYRRDDQPWRIYAFTDRPAYRPDETAQWKIVARRYNDGVYSTPAGQAVEFQITDPQGAKVKEGRLSLNQFGSAWDALELTDKMPLGQYNVTFWDEGRHRGIGNAVLFRLEEYKLPEFKVSVRTPEENGKKKAFRVGEKVEVEVQADYYFGGPVSEATVEVLVYQRPFYQWWYPRRDYAWYYEDLSPQYRSYGRGQGQIIKRETLKTDATGKAKLTFDTPRAAQQEFEYSIEARVTDASRREIAATGTVRVTRQRYYVYPRAAHNIYRPQDKATVNIKTIDSNDQPVEAEGRVRVTRDYWYEIWLDPSGREVKGDELKKLRERGRVWPPPPAKAGDRPWQLKFRGYEHDEILTRIVKTDREGNAEFQFTPEREGYYRVAWSSEDKDSSPIKAETALWVATNATTELGYRHGGLEIIVDKDTFRSGQKAAVMLSVPTNNRYVLFSVEGEDLYSYQLVHLTGTVKLVELAIEDKHVPNIFLSAAMVSDRQIFMDTEQVIVPPVEHFLSVEVKSDREEYEPRDEGTLNITTRDHDGKPVAAEVAVGLVDESVYYIQSDYAGDPRQFYYGSKRGQHIQTQSTFQQKSYAKLVENQNKQLIDEKHHAVNERGRQQVGQKDIREEDHLAKSEYAVETESAERFGTFGGGGKLRQGASGRLAINGREFEERARLDAPAAPPPPANKPAPSTGGAEPAVQVRSDFRSTILWRPDVVTDKDGKATVKVKYPDSLTGWTATARVTTAGNQFGIANGSTRTKQPLIVRLQAPRFFVVGDEVTVSAVINNNTDKPMTVTPSLNAEGVTVTGLVREGKTVKGEQGPVTVPANGEARVDWAVLVQQPGNPKLTVTARNGKHSDAMEKSYVAHEHGMEKFISKSGKLRGREVTVKFDIPKERKTETTSMTVQVAPSMAVTCLDALPYLIDYPYGCTEQTMSRFLPAAITAKTLKDLGLRPESVMGKVFGGIVEEHADKTHSKGKQDLRKLDDMVKRGLERLYDFQHADGGWGWWKEGDSDHFMTAYVVWGLTLARDAGIEIKPDALNRAVEYLDKEIVEEEANHDQQSWMLHALAAYHASSKRSEVGKFQAKAFENLWTNRERLNAYTRALFALAAHYYGYTDRAKTLVENLENGVKVDSAPDTSIVQRGFQRSSDSVIATAHWGEDGIYWRWSDGGVEATSFALRALLAIDPGNKLIEPVTNWLVKNRRGAQWSNTRDTAITVLTLNEYLRQSGELGPEVEYELVVNDHLIVTKKLTAEDALSAPSQFPIDPNFIRSGANEIRINRKSGNSPLYFSANAQFFSLEEPVTPAGNEIFVRREYYRLVGKPTLLKGYVYEKQLLEDGATITSGDRIEAVLTIEAKNNYEYLIFEDLKPAGLEAVQIRSGQPLYVKELKSGAVDRKFGNKRETPLAGALMQGKFSAVRPKQIENTDYTGRTRWVYQELRDRKVALFIDKLPEGVWEIRYDMRAEVPGRFHALPVIGHAMYVPEIRCNGAEARIKVADKE